MTPVVSQAIAWTLIHSVWQGAILALLVRMFRGYVAALAGMVAMLAASAVTFAIVYAPATSTATFRSTVSVGFLPPAVPQSPDYQERNGIGIRVGAGAFGVGPLETCNPAAGRDACEPARIPGRGRTAA